MKSFSFTCIIAIRTNNVNAVVMFCLFRQSGERLLVHSVSRRRGPAVGREGAFLSGKRTSLSGHNARPASGGNAARCGASRRPQTGRAGREHRSKKREGADTSGPSLLRAARRMLPGSLTVRKTGSAGTKGAFPVLRCRRKGKRRLCGLPFWRKRFGKTHNKRTVLLSETENIELYKNYLQRLVDEKCSVMYTKNRKR